MSLKILVISFLVVSAIGCQNKAQFVQTTDEIVSANLKSPADSPPSGSGDESPASPEDISSNESDEPAPLDENSDSQENLDKYACHSNSRKVLICHLPPGNSGARHNLCVSVNALNAHMHHANQSGDYLGVCQ